MDWVPIVFVTFKILVLGIGMFFAVKWHYDKANKGKEKGKREVLIAVGKIAVFFVLSLLVLGVFTYSLVRMMRLDLGLT